MQQLLFAVVLFEVVVIMALSFKTPIRKLLIMSLDRSKRGRGPVVIQTVSATVIVLLVTSVYNMMGIQKRWIEDGVVNPTDEVIMAKHLLESTLMGGFLFLGLMIDRLHHYMRELRIRRKNMEVIKKEGALLEGVKARGLDEVKNLMEEITSFGKGKSSWTLSLRQGLKKSVPRKLVRLLYRSNLKGSLLSLTGCLRKTRCCETNCTLWIRNFRVQAAKRILERPYSNT
ncbi:Contains similarity to BAP31 protein gb/X81816 from Mus musculus [Arabidopsis thaliana]|uniref:Endoplasmic reticulum transmembrane protein n=1 Tax=Arabidopsis thaliana TaxID=3702 RepID=O65391_ARATH|nr:Contains similarity to BAP31 protein gb/X81816 from Mus musculus [Arabidopsis thaliana]ACB88825.1 At1g11905 [Arabidopsis thaliana]